MKLERIIVDADFCIKIGASPKYRYLERILPELAETVYIHKKVYDEIIFPACAKEQIDVLRKQGVLEIIDENSLDPLEKVVYQGTYQSLANVMINPKRIKAKLVLLQWQRRNLFHILQRMKWNCSRLLIKFLILA